MAKQAFLSSLLIFTLFLSSCGNNDTKKEKKADLKRLNFNTIAGIKYYEVKRRFSSGLSFNESGFQQEPSWIIQFKSNDTVMAYNPDKKVMHPFYILYDHGDVYNFAKEYFRIKKIGKDSIVMQRLQLKSKEILKGISSDVNIVYYAKDYIENVLKTTPERLQRPTPADTLFITQLTARANRNPANPDSAFAGRQPVRFSPLSDMIRVKKTETVDLLAGRTQAYDYMFPSYQIDISRAYRDFAYEFSVVVDAKGFLHLTTFGNVEKEDIPARKKALEAIINVYLQNLLKITPAQTLGLSHPSEIKLVVQGKKTNN